MRKSRFTEEQIIGILQEVEKGAEARAVCRREGITEQTFYRWRQKYGGMQVSALGDSSSSRRRISG